MGKQFDAIDPQLAAWLCDQPVLFVGTAPLAVDGHLNVSPKGMAGTFAVLGPRRVAYLDYSGSGAETVSHLRENGRVVVMACAFTGPPRIVRLHGTGRAVFVDDPEFAELRPRFTKPETAGQRSIVVVEVGRIADSCGFAVPLMDHVADRDVLDVSHARREGDHFPRYWAERNAVSIDGLPAHPAGDLVPATEDDGPA